MKEGNGRVLIFVLSPLLLITGILILYGGYTQKPLPQDGLTKMVGKFDHYEISGSSEAEVIQSIFSRYYRSPPDTLFLQDKRSFYVQSTEVSCFKRDDFLNSVKKGQTVLLYVDTTRQRKDIKSVQSENMTYLSYEDSKKSDELNSLILKIIGYISLIIAVVFVLAAIKLKPKDYRIHYKMRLK